MPQSVADGITAKINGVCLHIIAAFYILAEIYLMVRAYKPDINSNHQGGHVCNSAF